MADSAINDYLTKQIKVNNNIVTFRMLSRALSMHVNTAKSALDAFYQQNKAEGSPLHATYFISGEDNEEIEDSMEVDTQSGVTLDAPSKLNERTVRQKMMVVPEEKLESAKLSFKSIRGMHIYSLEPSTFLDLGLLVTTVDAVRKVDATHSPEDLQRLGIPISSACKFNKDIKAKAKAGPHPQSKPVVPNTQVKQEAGPSTQSKKPSVEASKGPMKNIAAETTKTASQGETTKKPVKSGGLDWSKAKVKDASSSASHKPAAKSTNTATKPSKAKQAVTERAPSVSSSTTSETKPKRGIKRAIPPSEDEKDIDMQPPKTKARLSAPAKAPKASKASNVRAKGGVLLSDDDDDEEDVPPARISRGGNRKETVMDWSDDDNVVIAQRHTPGPPSSREDGGDEDDEDDDQSAKNPLGEEDEAMEVSDNPSEKIQYAKTGRSQKKKAWPVGSNGLRKRRVVKTRQYKDARGFLQLEDYSEYESVNSESEQPPDPASKPKTSKGGKATASAEVKKEEMPPKIAKSQTKESVTSTGGPKKRTLDSFFSKK